MTDPIRPVPYAPASATRPALRRLIGTATATCVGVGIAIGSGIFRTPGDVAAHVRSPWVILSLWVLCGAITLMQSQITAELATRFPKAGGEYEYLKQAYGEFAAFFFGWSCTVFILGGGAGTIAAALGDFAAELLRLQHPRAPAALGCAAIVAVTVVNAAGLRSGAWVQNALTVVKAASLIAIAAGAWALSGRWTPATAVHVAPVGPPVGAIDWTQAYLLALLPVFWSYVGATDAAKLAEEITDVHRALPRALVGAAVSLTIVYCVFNYALLCAMPAADMAGVPSVPAMIFRGHGAAGFNAAILVVSIVICLGAVSGTMLANARTTFALARDGLAFRFLGVMSRGQSPVGALWVGAAIACAFVLNRSFTGILMIYFLASAVLFGMTYASLIVFRVRDRRAGRARPESEYRAPAGVAQAVALCLLELALAGNIVYADWREGRWDSIYTLALLIGLAGLYEVWTRLVRDGRSAGAR